MAGGFFCEDRDGNGTLSQNIDTSAKICYDTDEKINTKDTRKYRNALWLPSAPAFYAVYFGILQALHIGMAGMAAVSYVLFILKGESVIWYKNDDG